jgi:hypothetical protein
MKSLVDFHFNSSLRVSRRFNSRAIRFGYNICAKATMNLFSEDTLKASDRLFVPELDIPIHCMA